MSQTRKSPAATGLNQTQANYGASYRNASRKTKKQVILEALTSGSLNRFEAERLGDHCLHSTVSELRQSGHAILSHWERVPTRWGVECRVKRYWLEVGR